MRGAQPDETSQPLGYVPEHIPEVEYLVEEAMGKAIKKGDPQSVVGPSGCCNGHLQGALRDELVKEVPRTVTRFFSSRSLTQIVLIS